ncbi:MAG: hypothetical protein [Circular genetic element sp.]|nr:MAG: hypothetical protein [Circular genetic element sp.]
MAKGRNNNKLTKFKKVEPAELTLNFTLGYGIAEAKRAYIDLSQCASLVNRRFYRQGLAWAVAGFTLHSDAGAQGSVTISKLPSTWAFSNAWHKGLSVWEQMNDEALEDNESLRPRFLDFKIYADQEHHEVGFKENLLPMETDTTGLRIYAKPGEWAPSSLDIPIGSGPTSSATHPRTFLGVGANYPGVGGDTPGTDAVSLIEGYAASRGLPNIQDPNTPDDAVGSTGQYPTNWIAAVSNEGTGQDQEVLGHLTTENNIAPYPFENDGTSVDTMYPGGANQLGAMVLVDKMSTYSTTETGITNRMTAKGGVFPCGLIQLNASYALNNSILQVHLVPGHHRGYMAEPMQDL